MTPRISRRMTPRVAPLACALLAFLAAPASAAPESVVIVQESNGFPGGEKSGQVSRQEVAIQGPRLRVLDRAHRWALFIDLDEAKVREASIDAKEYVERDFSFYERYREQREENLAGQAKQFEKRLARMDEGTTRRNQFVDAYRRAGGDPEHPGRITARLQYYPQDRRQASLRVGREERQVTLEHYVIRENQADTPVFDLWTTRNVDLNVDMLRFYRELGTFSPEVTAKLAQVPGVIVKCKAVLDTGTLKKTFQSEVLEVRPGEAPSGSLSVPAGFKQVEPGQERDAEPAGPQRTCAVCDEALGKNAMRYREPGGKRRLFHVCSQEHRLEVIKKIAAERKQ